MLVLNPSNLDVTLFVDFAMDTITRMRPHSHGTPCMRAHSRGTELLGKSQDARSQTLQWPDRGWNSKSDFDAEFRAGLVSRPSRGLIARAQTKAEADALAAALRGSSILAEVARQSEAREVVAPAFDPDRRSQRRDRGGSDDSDAFGCDALVDAAVGGDAAYTVGIAVPAGSQELQHRAADYFQEIVSKIKSALRAPDPKDPRRTGWSERGWEFEEEFSAVALATVCMYARMHVCGTAW